MTETAAFGAWLRSCRQSAGLSQEVLAERAGLSVRALRNLERGRTAGPHAGSLHRLADALGLEGQARADFIAAAGRRQARATAIRRTPVELALQPGQRPIVPRQLPATVSCFTGRDAELAALTGLLDAQRGVRAPTLVIAAVAGTAGVGKTAFAVHWAHQVTDRFPDGQLYVNLRGFDPSGLPVSPAEAIRGLLDAMGVPTERIPADLDAQAGLYRTLLAGKRMLVVLDNARDDGQVRPLLPGSPGCVVVVTSRSQLPGLAVTENAQMLNLDVLPDADAWRMLAARLGARRAAAEPEAVTEIGELCARLPLALAVGATRAATRPGLPLSALAAELRDAQSRLDVLDLGDEAASLRAVFCCSTEQLGPEAGLMFRLLGLHPGPDITAAAAASLAAVPVSRARKTLDTLARAHLITEEPKGRYAFHDLLRAYAAEQAHTADAAIDRDTAIGRVLDHYLQTAYHAALLLGPERDRITVPPPLPGVTPEHLTTATEAMAWLEAEHKVLLASVRLAAETRFDSHAWQLPWAMRDFLDRRGHWHDWAAVQRTALDAARRLGDTAGQAVTCRLAASPCLRLADYDQARTHLMTALRLYRQLGDTVGQARTHQVLSMTCDQQQRFSDSAHHDEQALRLFQAAGHRAGQAHALNALGWTYILLGDPRRGRTFCYRSLVLSARLGDRVGVGHTWDSLGYAEHQLGRHAEAAACYQRALRFFREFGSRFWEAETLARLGDTWYASSDSPGAEQAWRQALAIYEDLQHPDAALVRSKLASAHGQKRHEPPLSAHASI
jgi:transcriptional regulator with XRE-family HTH domain/tetratricopeptide (TPR) repeat protein